MRQRRARTPSSTGNRESNVVMPDLLPRTFSDASNDETAYREVDAGEECSVVEIKERELSSKIVIKDVAYENAQVDTISIFESCSRFEPEQVETVHIIDASSDTDTATSTPLLDRKAIRSLGSMDELKTELKRELETVTGFDDPVEDFSVKKQRISFDNHKAIREIDRDVLHDSEIAEEKAIKSIRLRPSLRELWMEERSSFYDNDNDNEEPLEFSDDEEIPRYSIEMDSDSDLVAAF